MLFSMATVEPEYSYHNAMMPLGPLYQNKSSVNDTNNNNNTGTLSVQVIPALHILIPVLFSIICVVGILGNLLVIVVVVSNQQMRNSTNMLIINLALADLFFIVICVPFTAVFYVAENWPFGEPFCKFYQYMLNATAYASVYTLVLMSIDRYLAVCHPIWSIGIRTARNALIVIIVSWLIILSVTVPVIFEYSILTIEGSHVCVPHNIVEDDEKGRVSYHGRMFYGLFFIFAYFLPLAVVCILYGLLLRRLLCGVTPGSSHSAESMRGKKRVTKMVVVVICIFAISWLPIHLRFLIQFFINYPLNEAFQLFQVLATCLAYMNSCVNPILYAFLSENFRKSFRKLLCCYSNYQQSHVEYERTHCQPKEHIEISKTYSTAVNNNSAQENNCK